MYKSIFKFRNVFSYSREIKLMLDLNALNVCFMLVSIEKARNLLLLESHSTLD